MCNESINEWKRFKEELSTNIKEVKLKNNTDKDILDLMLHMLNNTKPKISKDK